MLITWCCWQLVCFGEDARVTTHPLVTAVPGMVVAPAGYVGESWLLIDAWCGVLDWKCCSFVSRGPVGGGLTRHEEYYLCRHGAGRALERLETVIVGVHWSNDFTYERWRVETRRVRYGDGRDFRSGIDIPRACRAILLGRQPRSQNCSRVLSCSCLLGYTSCMWRSRCDGVSGMPPDSKVWRRRLAKRRMCWSAWHGRCSQR